MDAARKSTKDRILELLKKESTMTVTKLTERLSITHMAIRKHLNSLENDGLIRSSELRQPMGRPLQVFYLTPQGEKLFPKNYEGITLEFLQDIEETFGDKAIDDLFLKREKRLTSEYEDKLGSLPATDKIQELVHGQNEKGYMAAYSQIDENTFEIIEYNCPILAVANTYKTACSCETRMLRNVLGTENVSRVSCKTDNDDHCRFVIKFG